MEILSVKILTLLFLAMLTSACTTYSISNQNLLDPVPAQEKAVKKPLKTLPIHVKADQHCYESSRSGRIVYTTCSNKRRLKSIVKHFEERGFNLVLSKDDSDASITIEEVGAGGFVTFSTSLFNMLTLGLVPSYSYEEYIVSYSDPKKDISISKKVRISKAKSWFHMFMFNPENSEGNWQNRAEQNLIRSVLDEAQLEEAAS